MKNYFFSFLFITFIACSGVLVAQNYSLTRRKDKLLLTTSIIVPCHSTHAKYLPELLSHLKNQTVPPNEVVISISDADSISDDVKVCLDQETYPFKVVAIYSKNKVSEGGNRNIACSNAKGDIFICNDADDLPHPQRIEVIKYFFENYEVDFLVHDFYYNETDIELLELSSIRSFNLGPRRKEKSYARGCPALSRHVFSVSKWNEEFKIGIDVYFVNNVWKRFKNSFIIDAKIYQYREELSSYHLNES
jgi:glycosyltransferase involved in cell wall biosynthesis